MGAVYQARDLNRQTICAIKEMSLSMVPPEERAKAVQNFKAEAKMLASLYHPNLPTFSDFFTEGQRHFLASAAFTACWRCACVDHAAAFTNPAVRNDGGATDE